MPPEEAQMPAVEAGPVRPIGRKRASSAQVNVVHMSETYARAGEDERADILRETQTGTSASSSKRPRRHGSQTPRQSIPMVPKSPTSPRLSAGRSTQAAQMTSPLEELLEGRNSLARHSDPINSPLTFPTISHLRSHPFSAPTVPSEIILTTRTLSPPSPRPMAVGHGETYLTAMRDAVDRVCGDTSRFQVDEQLLQTYFVWQAPQHMPIDEELFRNPPGPYFSLALLYAVQAQASRHESSQDKGWKYADKADVLVMTSLSSPPNIPTVQALLILAGRDLALGQASSGWLKSGMAFRMISDMNVQSDIWTEEESLQPEAREQVRMRKRLFWSAYTWDKRTRLNPPSRLRPFSPLLSQEIEAIIQHIYSPDRFARAVIDESVISDISARLLTWRSRVSPLVLLDTAYLPSVSPPPHILTLNILYRTAWILLRRPMIGRESQLYDSRSAQQLCSTKSAEIHLLFTLHDRCFGLRNITYLLAYMAYVSATVDVAEALSGDSIRASTATKRLELTFRVLTRAAQHTPGIQNSIQHLRRKLASHHSDRSRGGALPSGIATPTTGHPTSDIRPEQIAHGLAKSHAPQTTSFDFNPAMQAGPTLEELIASLSSEGYHDSYEDQPLPPVEESTAFLPIWDFEWLHNS
ncbi:hypothetical protein I312_106385 [Cryptococcus bacillisporus CA1280]|uniref:uncharacterized protein n=1 Tax=Cryptococcus bacillisporus CA1280 TaxID=1296109 RepID=UPI003367149F